MKEKEITKGREMMQEKKEREIMKEKEITKGREMMQEKKEREMIQ